MRRKPNKVWVVVQDQHDTWSVWHGTRPVATGLSTEDTAVELVRRARRPHERVWLAEADGYRTDLTGQFRDPPEKRPGTGRAEETGMSARQRYLARYGRAPARDRARAAK